LKPEAPARPSSIVTAQHNLQHNFRRVAVVTGVCLHCGLKLAFEVTFAPSGDIAGQFYQAAR